MDDPKRMNRLRTSCVRRKVQFHAISAVTGEGVPQLIRILEKTLEI